MKIYGTDAEVNADVNADVDTEVDADIADATDTELAARAEAKVAHMDENTDSADDEDVQTVSLQ